MKNRFLLFGLLAWTTVVFSTAFTAEYLQWDDNVFILQNELLRLPWREFFEVSWTRYFFGDYLPLTLLSYRLEVELFGFSSSAQHLVNLLLHLLNISLLWRWLPLSRQKAFFVIAIFALHPMQSEVVMWVSERKSLLAIFFALLALLSVDYGEKKGRLGFLGYWLFFALSLLSKATVIFLPVILLCQDLFVRRNRDLKPLLLKHAPAFILAGIWGLLRVLAYGQSVGELPQTMTSADYWWQLAPRVATAFGFYWTSFVLPFHQMVIYPPYEGLSGGWPWLLGGLVMSGLLIWKYRQRKSAEFLFYAIWVFLLLAPILHFVPRINFVSDRYLYFPIVGMASLLALSFPKWMERKWFLGLLVIGLSVLTWNRSQVWLNNEKFWSSAASHNPQSGIARNNWGLELLKQKRVTEAVAELEAALTVGEKDGTSHLAANSLGMIYSSPELPSFRNLEKAESFYRKSIALSPRDSEISEFNLSLVLLQQGRNSEALSVLSDLQRKLSQAPDSKNAGLLKMTEDLISRVQSPAGNGLSE